MVSATSAGSIQWELRTISSVRPRRGRTRFLLRRADGSNPNAVLAEFSVGVAQPIPALAPVTRAVFLVRFMTCNVKIRLLFGW